MIRTSTGLTAIKCLGVILALTGCGELGDDQSPEVETRSSALASDAFTNPNGAARVVTVDGTTIDQNNPFFQSLGTNGRACVNCHQPSAAMTITPPQIQAVFNATSGTDPVFRLNDGANGPNAPVATLDQKRAAYSLLAEQGPDPHSADPAGHPRLRRPGRAESLREHGREPAPEHGHRADRDA